MTRFRRLIIASIIPALLPLVADGQVRVNNRVSSNIGSASDSTPRVPSPGIFGGQSLADTDVIQIAQPLRFNSTFSAPSTINTLSTPSYSPPSTNFGGPLNFGTINTTTPTTISSPTLGIAPISSGTLQIPTFSSPSSTLPSSTLSPTISNTLPTTSLGGLTFDEEELLGASPIFGPSNNLGFQVDEKLNIQNIEFARRLQLDSRGSANFGLSPWSSITELSPPSNLDYQDRGTLSADVDLKLPSLEESGQTGRIDPLASGLPRYDQPVSKIDESSRDEILSATDGILGDGRAPGAAAWDDNPLIPRQDTAGNLPPTMPGSLFGQMRETASMITSIKNRTNQLQADEGVVPSVRDEVDQSRAFLIDTQNQPLKTFSAGNVSPSEQFISSAEKYLREGQYYRALAHYEVALAGDRMNPLIYLGQGIAYIGAGEYYSAVRRIERAIDMFPEVAYFKFDLTEFIADADILDVRRADLEKQLADKENHHFRFLLGFMEYYMDLEQFGLKNLEKAADAAPAGSAIARFPELLKSAGNLDSLEPESSNP